MAGVVVTGGGNTGGVELAELPPPPQAINNSEAVSVNVRLNALE